MNKLLNKDSIGEELIQYCDTGIPRKYYLDLVEIVNTFMQANDRGNVLDGVIGMGKFYEGV